MSGYAFNNINYGFLFKIQDYFLEKLFCYIVKWTFLKCPKSKIVKKFLRKKAEKTILLER